MVTSVRLGDILSDPPYNVARACASLGWRVIPLSPVTKNPDIPGWQDIATTNVDEIDALWGWYTGHDVGVATGRGSGIWVLDLDVKNGKNGRSEFAFIKRAHGRLPNTFTVRSRSGAGLHLYWRYPDDVDVPNSSGRVGRGIDVLSDGKQVRAPARASDVIISVKPALAPDWLVKLVIDAGGARRTSDDRDRARLPEWNGDEEVTSATLRKAEDIIASAPDGQRNDTLNREIFKLAANAYATGVDRARAWEVMVTACQHNGSWYTEREKCVATFNSGWLSGGHGAGG